MALNNLGLGFVFTARDLASAKLTQLERRFSSLDERVSAGTARMSSAFKELGVGLATFTAGAAVVAGGLSLAHAAGRFEQGVASVGAVTRATTEQLNQLREAAISAGIETQFSPEEAVAGLQSLATAGQTAAQATRTLIPVLDLAAGSLGQLGVAQSAEAVVGTLNAYGLAADEAAGVTDKLLRVTQLTNFQTRDFQTGLAKAAAAGSVFGQSLDDVLITMGLLRNRNIDASSSSTAFRESVRRLGSDSRAQQAILGAGVQLFDQQSGKMRSVVDVMVDFADATRSMTDEERNRRVAAAFGARGLLAFNAVLNASFTTMRDGRQVTLQGAEAIEALRHEMSSAEGTAQGFRDTLLDTFAGQKTLLQGTLQTFAVVLGEPFAAVFKPLVRFVVEALNALLRAFQVIPAPLKRLFAGLMVSVGAFLALVGGVIAAKATLALLAVGLQALGLTLGGLIATLLPAVLMMSALGLAVAGFVVALKSNLGGLGDLARRVGEGVSLFFGGLTQLFKQGGLSGAVREELSRAEHMGLRRFLISTWQVIYRLGQLWEGFKDGFTRSIEEARPVFDELTSAFGSLQEELAGLFGELMGGVGVTPSAEFKSFGAIVGAALSTVVRWLTRLLMIGARVSAGLSRGFRATLDYLRPAFSAVGDTIEQLRVAWRGLIGTSDESATAVSQSVSVWRSLGDFLGQVLGGALTVITLAFAGLIKVLSLVVDGVRFVRVGFVSAGAWIGEVAGAIYLWFTETIPSAISGALSAVRGFLQPVVEVFHKVGRAVKAVFDSITDTVIKLLRKVPSSLLPERLARLSRQPLSTELSATGSFAALSVTPERSSRADDAGAAMPARSDSLARAAELTQLRSGLTRLAQERAREQEQAPPFQVNVQVDGETIARATHNAHRDNAGRSFAPLPSY